MLWTGARAVRCVGETGLWTDAEEYNAINGDHLDEEAVEVPLSSREEWSGGLSTMAREARSSWIGRTSLKARLKMR
jgi:hypothetical protein